MTFNLQQVKEAAARVVADFGPDHKNPGVDEGGCQYTNEYGDHCAAAQIATSLGVSVPDLMDGDLNYKTCEVVPSFLDNFDTDALDWLTKVQRQADNGKTWARAIANA